MTWKVEFYNESVEEDILNMPPKIQARMIKLLELIDFKSNFKEFQTEEKSEGSIESIKSFIKYL